MSIAGSGKPSSRQVWQGMAWGLLGVVGFAGSFPSAKFAVMTLDPWFIALGRAVVAGGLSALLLLWFKATPPKGRAQWRDLAFAVAGVVVGFPVLSTLSLKHIPVAYASIVSGALPLMTAVVASVFAGERHRPAFWLWSLLGCALVVGFAVWRSLGIQATVSDHIGFVLIFSAVIVCAFGYVAGARLARAVGSWQSICWSLVVSAPFLLVPVWLFRPTHDIPLHSWLGFGYQSLISMFLGFFAWYRGLALGGIARVGQVQLLQPFISLLLAAWLLGEVISVWMWFVAVGVVACVWMGRRS
ncbi:DMT family transporter [Leeia oryzae]|uniref:DMT family transporter n=1 Tax=Leeia oryzae TaxID=356662 RepID=UPI000381BDED|nr:DMT family transporter [Leeia oryzae]